jgi:hypothetical protein
MYTLRLRPDADLNLYKKDTPIYYVSEYSAIVEPKTLYDKGSDASGEHDEEPKPEVIHFRLLMDRIWIIRTMKLRQR